MSSASSLSSPHGRAARCDVLAVARECVEAQWTALRARGLTAGIELPCGPLPWLRLDESRFRHVLEGALASMAKSIGRGEIGIALWCERGVDEAHLHVELYVDEPGAELSFEIGLEGAEGCAPAADMSRGRALIAERHPARHRIVAAQLARLGLEGMACASGDAALAAFARTPGAFVWLGEVADLDPVMLARALRGLERQRGGERAHVVAIRPRADDETIVAGGDTGIDAVVDWPVSLDTLRALQVDPLSPDTDLGEATRRLFFEESRRDIAAIRAAWVRGDWAAAARHAHRIKGGTVVFGEERICALAERIELAARRASPDAAEVAERLAELESALYAHGA